MDIAGVGNRGLSDMGILADPEADELRRTALANHEKQQDISLRLQCIQTALSHGIRGDEAIKCAGQYYDFIVGTPRPRLVTTDGN